MKLNCHGDDKNIDLKFIEPILLIKLLTFGMLPLIKHKENHINLLI